MTTKEQVDITGLDKCDVLAVLYNSSRPQGLGFMAYDPADMTTEEAGKLLAQGMYFDYLKGRVMKLDLRDDNTFSPCAYDRDNGPGAAQRAIDHLRSNDAAGVKIDHAENVEQSAALTHNRLHQETRSDGGKILTMTLGMADVKDELKQAIDKAKAAVPKQ